MSKAKKEAGKTGQAREGEDAVHIALHALNAVYLRLRMFNKDALRVERRRWLDETRDIAFAAAQKLRWLEAASEEAEKEGGAK